MVKQHSSSTRMVKGLHRFTLEKYSLCKGIGHGKSIDSDAFTVGGHQWAISFFPDGMKPQGQSIWMAEVGLFLMLLSETSKSDEDGGSGVRCLFEFTLLDQSGKGRNLRSASTLSGKGPGPALLSTGKRAGYPNFIIRGDLEYGYAAYVKDDCLKIECKIGVLLSSRADEEIPTGPRCVDYDDDDVGADFITLLLTGQGSDVVFDVKGKKFRAHKMMLSARSSVFESMFCDQQQHQEEEEVVLITNTEPRVFEVLLHFIYSDTLPEAERALLVDGYAFGPSVSGTFGAKLLAAADAYGVVRLKTICESHLWRTISLGRFAFILSIADTCNANLLKHRCFKFAADNYADLVEFESFNNIRKKHPLLQNEIDDYISKEKHSETKKQDSASKQKLSLLVD